MLCCTIGSMFVKLINYASHPVWKRHCFFILLFFFLFCLLASKDDTLQPKSPHPSNPGNNSQIKTDVETIETRGKKRFGTSSTSLSNDQLFLFRQITTVSVMFYCHYCHHAGYNLFKTTRVFKVVY